MNVYTTDIFDKTDKVVGYLEGSNLHLDGQDFYLVESKKRIEGWRCYGIYNTNWRFYCKKFSNEIVLSIKSNCKYVRSDLILMDIVVRLGNEFVYNSLFA
jgi:hypothetical protein